MVAIPTKNIDNLTLTLLKRINTELPNVYGCSMFPDGRMVFSCFNQDKTIIFKADGSKDFEIDNIGPTFDGTEKGLQMISLSDESVTNVINTKLSNFAYVTTFGDKLFYTNSDNDSVTCCDYHGNILWTFCGIYVLEFLLGISVDNDGNVFVAGYSTKNVVVNSSDGQRYRQLLSRKDGLDRPTVLLLRHIYK
ncbi:unnamed protein product [Mytilus edulis]|uniref:Uncharacterized protein n=1 Tax=Mytilus edulis TaxID=6550 RepID=A0A8S3SCM2_MYTED|nr:unnamed protein product [Mytilus edulis]